MKFKIRGPYFFERDTSGPYLAAASLWRRRGLSAARVCCSAVTLARVSRDPLVGVMSRTWLKSAVSLRLTFVTRLDRHAVVRPVMLSISLVRLTKVNFVSG